MFFMIKRQFEIAPISVRICGSPDSLFHFPVFRDYPRLHRNNFWPSAIGARRRKLLPDHYRGRFRKSLQVTILKDRSQFRCFGVLFGSKFFACESWRSGIIRTPFFADSPVFLPIFWKTHQYAQYWDVFQHFRSGELQR